MTPSLPERRAHAATRALVWPPTVAVDPGARHTGVCLRVGTMAVEAMTVEAPRPRGLHTEATDYAQRVVQEVHDLACRAWPRVTALAEAHGLTATGPPRVAVETLVAPTPRPVKGRRVAVAPSVYSALPGAATVLGAVFAKWESAVRVAPLGALPDGTTGWDSVPAPAELHGRPPASWVVDGTERAHQRSAWAVAGAAHAQTAPAVEKQLKAVADALQPVKLSDSAALVAALRVAAHEVGAEGLLLRTPDLAQTAAVLRAPEHAEGVRESVSDYLDQTREAVPAA